MQACCRLLLPEPPEWFGEKAFSDCLEELVSSLLILEFFNSKDEFSIPHSRLDWFLFCFYCTCLEPVIFKCAHLNLGKFPV